MNGVVIFLIFCCIIVQMIFLEKKYPMFSETVQHPLGAWYDACVYCDEKFQSRTGNRHLRNTRDFDKVQIVSLTYHKKIGSCYIWIYMCVCKQIVCLYVILPQTRGCRSTNVFPVQDSLWQCCQYNQRLNELQFAAFIESHQPIPFSDPVTQPRSPLAAVCQLSSAFRGPGNFCGHTTVKSGDQY